MNKKSGPAPSTNTQNAGYGWPHSCGQDPVEALSQGERGVVGVFDQALTRLSGFFIAGDCQVRAHALVDRAQGRPICCAFARGRRIACVLRSRSARCAKRRVRSISWSTSSVLACPVPWLARHARVLGARGFCSVVFAAVWRQGECQLPEDRRLVGGIPPAATVVENGDL